jgi:hypothetical protein
MAYGPAKADPPVGPLGGLPSALRGVDLAVGSERLLHPVALYASRAAERLRTPEVARRLDDLRRRPPPPDLAGEWRKRIDVLGDLPLNSRARRDAFADMVSAFSLNGLRQVMAPERCRCAPTQHAVSLAGRLVRGDRLVATWHREILLDQGGVIHHLLDVEPPFRRAGVAPGLLLQGLDLYDRLGLDAVFLHAALDTGRWHWARCGFDFLEDEDREPVVGFYNAVVALTGLPLDTSEFTHASQYALAGSSDETLRLSFARIASLLGVEGGRALRERAHANGIDFQAEIPVGQAIMLSGPAWRGVLLLRGPSRAVFEARQRDALARVRRRYDAIRDSR